MPSITMTSPMCAALYLIYRGVNRRSVLINKYGIPRSALRALKDRGLIEGSRRGRYTFYRLTPLGREVVEANLDTLRKAFEIMVVCRKTGDSAVCLEAKHAKIEIPVPI